MLYDRDNREPLFEFLEFKFGKNRIIEEKKMGKSRADVVMVLPEEIVGIEIKSDADTYVRLSRQVKDYDLHFDRNYIVIGSTHSTHIEKYVPEYWGIISVEEMENNTDFYVLREAKKNSKLVLINKLKIIWRPELAHIQELNQLPMYKQKSKEFVIEKIIEKVPIEILQEQLSEELFQRDYNAIAETIQNFRMENGKKKRRKKRKLYK